MLLALFAFVLLLNSTNFISDIIKITRRNFFDSHNLETTVNICLPIIKLYLPYLIMVGLDIKVISSLRQSKKRALNGKGVRSGMNKFTISTILIDFILLIFKSPQAIFQFYSYIMIIKEGFFRDTNETIFINLLRFTDDIAFSYSAFIIFIFVIFNQLFRKEIISYFTLRRLSFFSSIFFSNSFSPQN